MACSRFQYVKAFEQKNDALGETFIVVRVDGRGFTKFCEMHQFAKPNDMRAIGLMTAAAQHVCEQFKEVFLAYGQSDEYSFAFARRTTLFSRRTDKITSCVVSAFTSAYVFNWSKWFDCPLRQPPAFDCRVVLYPNAQCLKDYFRWRQVDCHINNLYNTAFWALVRQGTSHQETQRILKLTNSAQKNQLLFQKFNLNYNTLPEVLRRGTFLIYVKTPPLLLPNQTAIMQHPFEINQQYPKQIQESVKLDLEQTNNQQIINNNNEIQQKISISKQKKTNKQQKKRVNPPKLKKSLNISYADCIKQQFWLLFDLE